MGLIADLFAALFGGGRNLIAETAQVFVENGEARAVRAHDAQGRALAQFGAEFNRDKPGVFDRIMDGLNRLPRPFLALGTVGLFVSAMVDPLWFAARMQGIALVPEPLWWLLGVIVSFYFGARHQRKSLEFQRDIAVTLADTQRVAGQIADLAALRADRPDAAGTGPDAALAAGALRPDANPALDDWRARQAATM